MAFDGVDDYVDCGNDASLQLTDNFTAEAWVYPDEFDIHMGIVGKRLGAETKGWILGRYNDNRFVFMSLGTDGEDYVFSDSAYTTSRWYHVVGTYDKDGGSNNIKIYLNGEQGDQATLAETIDYIDTGPFYIARYPGGGALGYGLIALVRIHNRVLSALEIQNHFQREKHLFGVC